MIQLADLIGRLKTRFYDATVSHKIELIVMVVLGCTMMLSAVINISLSTRNNLQHSHENLQEIANSLSLSLQGPLVFKDNNGAREVLHSIQGNPDIFKAEVRNKDRVVLASYTTNYPNQNNHQFVNLMGFPHAINVTNSIKLNSDVIGTISLHASLDSLWAALLKQLIQSIAVATLLLYLAFFVSRRIAEIFVEPIKKIAKTAIDIRSGKDYSRHVINTSRDEVGQLANEFNKMLDVISQREQALKDSEFLWKFAIEGAGDGVWDVNIQTGEARYSKRWKEMLGYADNDLLPTINDWSTRIHIDDKLIVEDNLKAYLEDKTNSYTVEYRMRCKDESYKWVLSRGVLVSRSQDGQPLRMIGTHADISVRKAASEEINNLAFYDTLTRLPNRRLLVDRLQQAFIASSRHKQAGALLFLDLDHFKTLNDSLGHNMGDLLLQQVAERLKLLVREGDTVARIGGDEFVIILEDLSKEALEAGAEATLVANKILTSLEQVYQLDTHQYYNTVSIGITMINDHELEVEDLLRHADIAMYDAKKSGRNTFHFFDPGMQEAINTRAGLERDLRIALKLEQFQLYYQIQINQKGHSLGAEALIRWHHPQRGIVSPIIFIPLAEDTGLILPIGLWVLEAACAQLKTWEQDSITRGLTISVNVSAKQFKQAEFASQVEGVLQRHAINPSLLKLELTESMLIDDFDHIATAMRALSKIGVRFELDDFGTGYSSLQYLKELPLHQLKIDQSFVHDIVTNSSDRQLVHTIILMAHSLDLEVIAEGVETDEQLQFLADSGCNNYQGYLFGRPMPINEFEDLIRKR
jgi:diguanylate cyclase (GGDEF)-like protein/PAS domain S-box-containing protein